MRYFFQQALLSGGWADNVAISVDNGVVTAIEAGADRPVGYRASAMVPGSINLHSHAFQRGMAGLAERRGASSDSFWTWRDVMYRFVDRITPDDCRAIAAMAYCEMLEAGYTRVTEFHYLHHDLDGAPYADIAEMAGQVCAAARDTGIGMTLLPVHYQYGNFGAVAAGVMQRRFLNDADRFAQLVEASRPHVAATPLARLGVAPHSLRAVDPQGLARAASLVPDGPVHMHIAEQPREVADSLAWSNARPVEWLLDHEDVDGRWCLIHATHMTPDETTRLAATGAIGGLCPVTEANLGDGTFPAGAWLACGGRYGVGTDSNVAISLTGELRSLEYSQRLATGGRNVLSDRTDSTGRSLFDHALGGGAQAAGIASGIAVGAPADFIVLDLETPTLCHRKGDAILDSWIFGHDRTSIRAVVSNGREVVADGIHVGRAAIERQYRDTIGRLVSTL